MRALLPVLRLWLKIPFKNGLGYYRSEFQYRGRNLEALVSTSVITPIPGPGISFSMSDSISTLGISPNRNSVPDVGISGQKFQKSESVSIRGRSLEFNSRCRNTPNAVFKT